MFELLPGIWAVVLKNADVLEAVVVLQVLDTQSGETQKLLHLAVTGIPQMPPVVRVLQQDLMSSDRTHAVIQPIAATRRVALNPVQRLRMDHRARRPRTAVEPRHGRNNLQWLGRWTAKTAGLGAGSRLRNIVSRDDPGASDRIFAQFHGV